MKNLGQLMESSEEYMIPLISKIVWNEIQSLSKTLELTQWNKTRVVELLKLADKMDCQDAIDNCSRYLTSKVSRYGADDSNDMRSLIGGINISMASKNKIKGLVLHQKIEEIKSLTKDCNIKCWSNYKSCNFNDQISDIRLIANDLTATSI